MLGNTVPGPFLNSTPSIMTRKLFPGDNFSGFCFRAGCFWAIFTGAGLLIAGGETGAGVALGCVGVGTATVGSVGDEAPESEAT